MKTITKYMLLGLLLNLVLHQINELFNGMLYMDMTGTILCALLLGPWWGAIVGCLTNVIITSIDQDPAYINFTVINVLAALLVGFFARSRFKLLGEKYSQGKVLLYVLAWGFILSFITSTLAILIKNNYALNIEIDSNNTAAFSLFVVGIKGQIVSIFAGIPYDLMSSFPDKIISVALAFYLMHYFINSKYYRMMNHERLVAWGTPHSIIVFIAIYTFPFYDIAIGGMVCPGLDCERQFHWLNSLIWSLPIVLAPVAWYNSEAKGDYEITRLSNYNVDFNHVYDDVIRIITVVWSSLLSSRSAFTEVEHSELVKDGMGMIAFISTIGLIPPFMWRYFGRNDSKVGGKF